MADARHVGFLTKAITLWQDLHRNWFFGAAQMQIVAPGNESRDQPKFAVAHQFTRMMADGGRNFWILHVCCWCRCVVSRRVILPRTISRMAAAFVRIATTFGLLLLVVFAAWTTLFISARYTHRLLDRSVYRRPDPADNRTWKSSTKLLVAGNDGQFYLNGKPKRLMSGELHYFRVHPSQWDDRLRRMRTAGLNTITTRIPWNLHEQRQSAIHFRGMWHLADFIRIVHRLGFLLIVHVGPYIDADWEFGGLPSWLLRDRHMMVRTSTYSPFLQYVDRYFAHLLPIIDRHTFRKHGPIIALQVRFSAHLHAHLHTGSVVVFYTLT